VAAARHVAQDPGKSYNPLFIYGGVGLGKTHLLMAIANEIQAIRSRARVEYLTSEDFVNRYVEALQNKTLPAFRQHFRGLDLLLIDDVQFFEGKVGTSEEFFHTFNSLQNHHKQIVLASDRTPKELNGLASRLLSRFEGGLSAEILPPGEVETRMAILRKKQEAQPIKLPDPVMALIAERIYSNIRNLEGALTRLVMHVSIFKQEMSVALATELLRDKFETEQGRILTATLIQRAVSEYFQVSVPDLLGPRRPKQIAMARMVAMYLARTMTQDSLPGIGRAFNRDHATVVHAVSAITSRMDTDESLRTAVTTLTRQLQHH
jgi:chromosomal replication initiator protein